MAQQENERGPGDDFRLHSNFVQMPRGITDIVLPINGLPATYFRVLLFLIRKLVGWGLHEDGISLTQIEKGANVGRRDASAALQFWEELGIFKIAATGKRGMNRVQIAADLTAEDTWVKAGKRIRDWIIGRNMARIERKRAGSYATELVT